MDPAAALIAAAASWPSFSAHLDVLALLAVVVVAYEYGIRRLAPRYCPQDEQPVSTGQRVAFYLGLFALAAVSLWPIHDLGEQRLFLFHMIEQVVIALIVPPLLLGGTPWWLLRALVRPILPVIKFLTKPLIALAVFNVWFAVIHLPSFVEAMVGNEFVHFLIHAVLFLAAVLMWWPVLDPIPDTQTLTPFGKMGYLFLQSLVPTIPASFMTLGSTPLYSVYETFPRMWDLSAMTDQVSAGLIMKIGGGLILWGWIAWVFFSWYAEEQKYATPPVVVRSTDRPA
jgi:putative membrane protein